MAAVVDEERGGARHAAEVGGLDILGDARRQRLLAQTRAKALDIEPELIGVAEQVLRGQSVLVPSIDVSRRRTGRPSGEALLPHGYYW